MKTFIRDVWFLTVPYWRSAERWIGVSLLCVIVSLNLGEVYLNVLFNKWNNDFYNALQALDKGKFFAALIRFGWLALFYIVDVVYKLYLTQALQIRWRRWLTGHFIDRWLDRQAHYRMQLAGSPSDNPDQRISQDIGQFIDLTLGLSLGLLNSVVTLFSFLFILWTLSGVLTIPLGSFGKIHIPGYMVWAAVIYSIIGTWITSLLGRPLIRLNFNQQMYEADFRFALVRLRENSEKIALYKGEAEEKTNFFKLFTSVFDNYWAIMKRQKTLGWFTSFYFQAANVFPILVAAPMYFAKKIKLGGLMQTASAFGQVQNAFSYIINAYTDIATWKAVVERLHTFTANIAETEAQAADPKSFKPVRSGNGAISVDNMTVRLPDGRVLLKDINLTIDKGSSLLINGPSGSGKSTLLRILAGIWPYADGALKIPAGATTLFLPQTPYLPIGTLRQALCYPHAPREDDKALRDVLKICRLDRLVDRLDDVAHWEHVLSPGEQQRIAFARAMLASPDFIFLDEATSALDAPVEEALYIELRKRLPAAAIVSVGHRDALKNWHDKTLTLPGF